ncbi:MAG: WG repeat-containing protein, partial [Rikenella sp.]|nr:WG repeat-containing protein [Rikenella sp.]
IEGLWGYVDGEFRLLSRPRFDDAWPLSEGRGLVRKGARYGYVGADGRLAIPIRYDFAQGFREGAACVMVDGLYGYIDRRGRYLVEPTFDYARSKRDGTGYVERAGKGELLSLSGPGRRVGSLPRNGSLTPEHSESDSRFRGRYPRPRTEPHIARQKRDERPKFPKP